MPQLALLRRARLAIINGGFNTLDECAPLGVPTVVLPWVNDQARNAALVEYHGVGVALDRGPSLSNAALDAAVTRVANCSLIRGNCERMRRTFEAAADSGAAHRALHRLAASATACRAPPPSPPSALSSTRSS